MDRRTHFRYRFLGGIFSAIALMILSPQWVLGAQKRSKAVYACTEKENWNLTSPIPAAMVKDFMAYLDDPYELSRVYRTSYSHMNGTSRSVLKLFGHYWVARALFEENLYHLAFQKFQKLISVPFTKDSVGIQMAALECTVRIQDKITSFRPQWKVVKNVRQNLIEKAEIRLSKSEKDIVGDAVLRWVRNYVGTDIEANELASLLPLIRRGSKKQFLVRALISVKRRNYSEAARDLRKVLNLAQSQRESSAASESLGVTDDYFIEVLRLTRARVLFESGDLKEAVRELEKMEKTSSEFMHALQQRSWVYLIQGNYRDAIGMALSLHSTGFENTFTPAALMVVAMSFSELCQYPSAQRVLKRFGRQYGSIYKWMRDRRREQRRAPYDYVSAYLKGKKTKIPKVVLSEWLRSQVFIGKQEELNVLFAEKEIIDSLSEERKRGLLAYRRSKFLIQRLRKELVQVKRQLRNPASLVTQKREIMSKIEQNKGVLKGVLAFKGDLMKLSKALSVMARDLVAEINQDLERREERMLKKIGSLFEIAHLLQVELLEGAGEDIVWRSTHKDYFDFSLKNREKQLSKMQADGFSWGYGPEVTDGLEEVWEDELGTLQANVANRCETKQNYLKKIESE